MNFLLVFALILASGALTLALGFWVGVIFTVAWCIVMFRMNVKAGA